jgi:3-dehydroquinate dehydratase type I
MLMMVAKALGNRLLAVVVGTKTAGEARAVMSRVAKVADVAELRVDLLEEALDLPALLADHPLPVIVTDRAIREGGRSPREDRERLAVLGEAAALGAEFVDLEWDEASNGIVNDLKASGTRVIVSRHAFDRMPSDIDRWAIDQADRGADVVKVAGMARDPRDVLPILNVLRTADRPTIAIAMGEAGIASRLLALRFDRCQLTFAAHDRGPTVAPGQLPIDELRDGFNARRIGPATTVFGVLAPTRESVLLRRFNAWFIGHAIDAVAVPFVASADAASILTALQDIPVSGWYVPDESLQRELAVSLSEITPEARRRGLVNSVAIGDGRFHGSWLVSPSDQVEVWAG